MIVYRSGAMTFQLRWLLLSHTSNLAPVGTGCFGCRPVGTLVSDLRTNAELFIGGMERRETNGFDLEFAAQLAT